MTDSKKIEMDIDISFDDFVNPKTSNEIVSNKTFDKGDWNEVCMMRKAFSGTKRRVLPIDFRDFCMLVVSEVEPNTTVPKHVHKEGIARYIISGSLVLNGEEYKAGDWILVPEDTPYEIFTEEGYTAIAGYLQACETDDIS
ncbi:MAG: cupin domain-containing protein [Candidatus Sedimenticola sp. (ex Thyasira tokunagai)]